MIQKKHGLVASHSVMRVGAGEQKMTNAEGDGEKKCRGSSGGH